MKRTLPELFKNECEAGHNWRERASSTKPVLAIFNPNLDKRTKTGARGFESPRYRIS
jgi:hypothetical protein